MWIRGALKELRDVDEDHIETEKQQRRLWCVEFRTLPVISHLNFILPTQAKEAQTAQSESASVASRTANTVKPQTSVQKNQARTIDLEVEVKDSRGFRASFKHVILFSDCRWLMIEIALLFFSLKYRSNRIVALRKLLLGSVSTSYMKVKASTHVTHSRELGFLASRHWKLIAAAILWRCDVETSLSIGHLYADCAEEINNWTGQIRQVRGKVKSVTEIKEVFPQCVGLRRKLVARQRRLSLKPTKQRRDSGTLLCRDNWGLEGSKFIIGVTVLTTREAFIQNSERVYEVIRTNHTVSREQLQAL